MDGGAPDAVRGVRTSNALRARRSGALRERQPGPSALLAARDLEAELLRGVLDGVQLLEVRAPFPTDPRKVADALAKWC